MCWEKSRPQTVETATKEPVTRRLGMGSTGIVFEALTTGAIDVYSDYTGTLAEAILKRPDLKSVDEIQSALLEMNLVMSGPLGFDDTYALAVKESFAMEHDLHSISDLQKLEGRIRAAFSYEFMDRKDGFQGIVASYPCISRRRRVSRMEHSLTFQAIDDGAVDLIDLYSTTQRSKSPNCGSSRMTMSTFPCIRRCGWRARCLPRTTRARGRRLLNLQGSISEHAMIEMNAQADIQHVSYAKLRRSSWALRRPRSQSLKSNILQRTREHLWLVGIALLFSVLVGIPWGSSPCAFTPAGRAF